MTWDPRPPLDQVGAGWREWADGHPVAAAMGLLCVEAGPDSVVTRLARAPVPNPNGAVNGGVLAAALDQTLALATLRVLPAGAFPTTTNMHVVYLRPVLAPLTVRARVLKGGQKLVFVRGEVEDERGRACVTCDATFAVIGADRVTQVLHLGGRAPARQ